MIVANSNPFGGTLYARRNWWSLSCGLTPSDMVSDDVDVKYASKSPLTKFQSFIALEKQGDFNADGKINFDDFFLFVSAYGASCGVGSWNPRFDLSGNGQIDYQDFSIFVSNFGVKEHAKIVGLLGAEIVRSNRSGDHSVIICPNPFNSQVHISFLLPKQEFVSLKILNILGQEVVELMNSSLVGPQLILWDGRNKQDQPVASGRYYIVFSLENLRLAKPVILLR